jgi:FkbM family methyltransferase
VIEQIETRYGTMFIPTTDQGQYWWLHNTGVSPEDEFIEVVCDLLDEHRAGVAIDVGANFGCWTLPLSKHSVRVVAFEPQKCCADLITRSIEAGSIGNVRVENKAVGANAGIVMVPQLDIETAGNFGGISLVSENDQQPGSPKKPVPMLDLDSYDSGGQVSFIKIDVEGGEVAVLRGAARVIARDRPIMMMEMDHKATDLGELEGFLIKAGYVFEQYGPNYLCMPI